MCASPAAKYVWLDAATAPEVDGPRIPTTLLSATYFCASACAGAGPCSTGVSPRTSWILRPSFGASVLTAYFAQLDCSCPRKPAPPVSGVTKAILSVLLQLMPADAFASDRCAACAVAATTDEAAAIRSRAMPFFICP